MPGCLGALRVVLGFSRVVLPMPLGQALPLDLHAPRSSLKIPRPPGRLTLKPIYLALKVPGLASNPAGFHLRIARYGLKSLHLSQNTPERHRPSGPLPCSPPFFPWDESEQGMGTSNHNQWAKFQLKGCIRIDVFFKICK